MFFALQSFLRDKTNKAVLVRSDNGTAIACLNNCQQLLMWNPASSDIHMPPVSYVSLPDKLVPHLNLEASDSITIESFGFSIVAEQWESRPDYHHWRSALTGSLRSGRKKSDEETKFLDSVRHNNVGGLSIQQAWFPPKEARVFTGTLSSRSRDASFWIECTLVSRSQTTTFLLCRDWKSWYTCIKISV